jgi:hypothetical protein
MKPLSKKLKEEIWHGFMDQHMDTILHMDRTFPYVIVFNDEHEGTMAASNEISVRILIKTTLTINYLCMETLHQMPMGSPEFHIQSLYEQFQNYWDAREERDIIFICIYPCFESGRPIELDACTDISFYKVTLPNTV